VPRRVAYRFAREFGVGDGNGGATNDRIEMASYAGILAVALCRSSERARRRRSHGRAAAV